MQRVLLSLLTLSLITGAGAQQAKELRLGVFPNVTHAAGLVGVQRGLIQKNLPDGVKLVVREFANGSQINEAFAAGAIDAAYVGPGPAMNAFMRGVPIQVIAGAANAGAVLVARGDSGIRTIKALGGKKVAVPTRGSTQDISLRHLLHENGLKASDENGTVTIVPIDPANMPAAFAAKQVDAALVQEPWGAVLETQGAKLVANEKAIWAGGNYTTTVLTVNTKYAAANSDTVRGLLRGHLASISFIQSSNAGAQKAIADQIAAFTGKRPNTAELFKALARTKVTWDINLTTLGEYAQLNKEAGFARDVPDLSKFVDLSVIRSLAK
ncbi:NitT/TauT family transport system substrate-binding protein [Deinococcus metalli]|uniref:ABC transporter substrate-binding protein n=1 Tax=Deinococcus metalli TaxID=1141878 RepID=A0A7W8NNU1_9DEIO|nr:ABC transporter substrate-binding protein [Deinococcus metalli]MBB5377284.1 NitT/TauT family transport system substrate-binding protein [Deinococcus metalli]GHF47635.1 ABC transporter substrate-binding protein [Deinococcus metalli]